MKRIIVSNKLSIIYIFLIILISFLFTIFEFIGLNIYICKIIILFLSFITTFFYGYISCIKSKEKLSKCILKTIIKVTVINLFISLISFNSISVKKILFLSIHAFIIIFACYFANIKKK